MSRNPFTLISTKKIYENPWISLREDSVIQPGGKEGIFGVVSIQHGVSILAMDIDGNVLLIDEFRYAIGGSTPSVPGGGIDIGESPLDAAKREMEEEIGYVADEWINLGFIYPLTTVVSHKEYLFLAKGLHKTKIDHEGGEIIDNIRSVPFDEAVEMVINSEIVHAPACICILKSQKYLI